MDVPSYHQILAEQYEENAKNLLVYQKQYEDEDEDGDVDYHQQRDYDVHDLPDKELFNRTQERHDLKNIIPAKEYEDKTRNSIRYDKDIKTHIVDIDSRFRAYPKASNNLPNVSYDIPGVVNEFPASNVANFTFSLPKPIKNAITIKITSITFPNIFYTFSKARENYGFNLHNASGTLYPKPAANVRYTVEIDDGNYKDINDLVTVLDTKIKTVESTFEVTYDKYTNKITISNTSHTFGIDFTPPTVTEPFNSGIGYNLGYLSYKYGTAPYTPSKENSPQSIVNTGKFSLVGETFPDIYGDSYVYLSINDYDVIEHQSFKQTFFPVFAKLMLPFNTKNQLINDIDLLNLVQRQYNFLQPINIQKLLVTVYDAYGRIVDMKNSNFSFTLQIEEILNPALYEKLREL